MSQVQGRLSSVEDLTRSGVTHEALSRHLKHLDDVVYSDVVDRRVKEKLCGYPLCDHILTSGNDVDRWRIEEAELRNYCSLICFKVSMNLVSLLEIEAFPKHNVTPHNESLDTSYLLHDYSAATCDDVEELCREFENLRFDESSDIDTSDTSVYDDGLDISVEDCFRYVSSDTESESESDTDSIYSDESSLNSSEAHTSTDEKWKSCKDSSSDSEEEDSYEQCEQEIEIKATNRRRIIPVRRVKKN